MSQFALSRSLSPGGSLDRRYYVDFGNKEVLNAVMHYLDVCFVNVVILQPNCRTSGLPFYLILRSTMARGMNTRRKTFHTSSYVAGLPFVKTTSD
eukprot:2920690-Pyramimonas_sp.AAC.2